MLPVLCVVLQLGCAVSGYVVCCECGMLVSVCMCTCPGTYVCTYGERPMLSVFSMHFWSALVLSQGLSLNLPIRSAVPTGASGIHVTLPQIQASADIRGSIWPGTLPTSTTPRFSRGC